MQRILTIRTRRELRSCVVGVTIVAAAAADFFGAALPQARRFSL